MMDDGGGVRVEGKRLSVKEEGSGGELGSDLDPDPWKILWIRIRNTGSKAVNVFFYHSVRGWVLHQLCNDRSRKIC